MGGNWIFDDDLELATSSFVRTMVLVGRTGNGKSATGNSILGYKGFESKRSSNGVTRVCQLKNIVSEDGMPLNVIDTPGLFDFSADPEFVGREIARCINMAKDGIHAVLLVLSVRSRFTREEEATIMSLQKIFGDKIMDYYMVVVFTGGDDLDDDDNTLEDYLNSDFPEELRKIMDMCGKRLVLFDNKTHDKGKKAGQLQRLLLLVNQVVEKNGGRPFTNDIFKELKKGAVKYSLEGCSRQEILELKEIIRESHYEQMNQIAKMVELKLKETITRLEQQLAEEQAARLRAEESAREDHNKSDEETRKLRENIERAREDFENTHREHEELRSRLGKNKCAIL